MALPRLPVAINTVGPRGQPEAMVYCEVEHGFWAPPEWLKLYQTPGVMHRWLVRASFAGGRPITLGGVKYRVDGKLIYPVRQKRQYIILESEYWGVMYDF